MSIDTILDRKEQILEYLNSEYKCADLSIYSSVDVRSAEFKVVAVDTNLFPAGFNNLSQDAKKDFAKMLADYLLITGYADACKILVLAEEFSRNLKYWDNINALVKIIEEAGYEAVIGSVNQAKEIKRETGDILNVRGIVKNQDALSTDDGFIPDIILLNNDLTQDIPEVLQGVKQPILPNPVHAWSTRRKYKHFRAYNHLVAKLADNFDFDPWLLSSFIKECGQIDFRGRQGIECVAAAVDEVILQIKNKYKQYNIDLEPFVFVKANRGTHGVGIMCACSGSELLDMNKKARHSMHAIKHGVLNDEVVIQEGIPTMLKYEEQYAENTIYLVGRQPAARLIRYHAQHGNTQNLNSKGAQIIAEPLHEDLIEAVAVIAACSVADE